MKDKHREKAEKLLGGKIELVKAINCPLSPTGITVNNEIYMHNSAIDKAVPIVAELLEKVEELEKEVDKYQEQVENARACEDEMAQELTELKKGDEELKQEWYKKGYTDRQAYEKKQSQGKVLNKKELF